MQIVETFQSRLKKAMDFNNIKQVDLVNKTKLDKTLINKYLAGIMKAKQDKLTILADALNVNEVWLMGYDVPMEREIYVTAEQWTQSSDDLLKKIGATSLSDIQTVSIPLLRHC